MTYNCGQKPGKGTYVCNNCGEDLVLDDTTDTLPPCAKCNNCKFDKSWCYTIKIVRIAQYFHIISHVVDKFYK